MPDSCWEDVRSLESWMRERGVRRAKWGDIELELGELPRALSKEPEVDPALADARHRTARRNELREELQIRYAHVGGWSGSDEELDIMLGQRDG